MSAGAGGNPPWSRAEAGLPQATSMTSSPNTQVGADRLAQPPPRAEQHRAAASLVRPARSRRHLARRGHILTRIRAAGDTDVPPPNARGTTRAQDASRDPEPTRTSPPAAPRVHRRALPRARAPGALPPYTRPLLWSAS